MYRALSLSASFNQPRVLNFFSFIYMTISLFNLIFQPLLPHLQGFLPLSSMLISFQPLLFFSRAFQLLIPYLMAFFFFVSHPQSFQLLFQSTGLSTSFSLFILSTVPISLVYPISTGISVTFFLPMYCLTTFVSSIKISASIPSTDLNASLSQLLYSALPNTPRAVSLFIIHSMGFQPLLYHLHRPFSFFCRRIISLFFFIYMIVSLFFSSTRFLASFVQSTELCLVSHLQGTRPVFSILSRLQFLWVFFLFYSIC
jgi:hypothetical protein